MRGVVDKKLTDFLKQVNISAEEARKNNTQFTPELVRKNLEKLACLLESGPELLFVEDRTFSTLTHNIPVRVYSPSCTKKLPVLLHFHGGGHMCGNVELYDPISRKIACQAQCIVICIDYRLAPENPYPAGIDDCEYALIHYKKVLQGLNYNNKIYTLGDSAGGAICTTLAMRIKDNALLKIDKQILLYPSVDYTMNMPSINENGSGFLLEKPRIHWYFNHYFQNNEKLTDVSPLYNPHSMLPETLIITGGCDPLRDEGLAYVKLLQSLNIPVKHKHFEGMIHAYMLMEKLVKEECNYTYKIIANYIKA